MELFRWQNCYADVQTYRHATTMQTYLDDVIIPALDTLDRKAEELEQRGGAWAAFAKPDMQDVIRETKLAFSLAIQSIWERQLRAYIIGCAKELRPAEDLRTKIERADWEGLQKYYTNLRGIELRDFPSYSMLDILHHLGNAARHGDGKSAARLVENCPDLWPHLPPQLAEKQPSAVYRSVALIDVPVLHLKTFAAAVADFWNDTEYIYNESIERKDPSLEAKLARDRIERTWVPKPAK